MFEQNLIPLLVAKVATSSIFFCRLKKKVKMLKKNKEKENK
jgi:hypothetical protein